MQVTPLQVARYMAAVANGGPYIGLSSLRGSSRQRGIQNLSFARKRLARFHCEKENLDILREALLMVTQNPRGTARQNLRGLQFDVAARRHCWKSGSGKSHAWFAGYTLNAVDTGQPDIAIAVHC